jgi:hypothetical protein
MAVFRHLFLAIFVLSAGIATYFAEELFFPEKSAFPRDSVEYSIDSDLIHMKKEDPSVNFFHSLKKVYLSDHRIEKTPINWTKIFSNHFIETTDSKKILQIDLFDSADGKNKAEENLLILQYSLIDETTKNKLWELSKTYQIPKSN